MASPSRSLTVSPSYYLLQMLWKVLRFMLMLCFSFVILYPLIYSASMAFRTVEDVYNPSIVWLPMHYTLDNFRFVMEATDYTKVMVNSLVLTTACSVLQVMTCSLVGYGFGRFRFKFKEPLFVLVLFTILVPPQLVALPTYILLKDFDVLGLLHLLTGSGLQLLDKPVSFFILAFFGMGIRSGLFVLILRQCYTALPKELEDAALVDGCGSWKAYFVIMMPNAKNSLLMCFLFSFVWYWNDYYMSSIYLANYPTVSTSLANLKGRLEMMFSTEIAVDPYQIVTMMQAGCLLTIGLLVVIYIAAQKYFTQGIQSTGIVG